MKNNQKKPNKFDKLLSDLDNLLAFVPHFRVALNPDLDHNLTFFSRKILDLSKSIITGERYSTNYEALQEYS